MYILYTCEHYRDSTVDRILSNAVPGDRLEAVTIQFRYPARLRHIEYGGDDVATTTTTMMVIRHNHYSLSVYNKFSPELLTSS